MIFLHNERLACEQCIRGHRAADCQHLAKPLISIKGRGRPPAKDLSIRYKVDPFPNVVNQTWEPIESKNGRGRPGTRKLCFHVDPETPVETYQVKLGRGFEVIGPYDPPPDFQYQGAFRVRKHIKGNIYAPVNTFGSSKKSAATRQRDTKARKQRLRKNKANNQSQAQQPQQEANAQVASQAGAQYHPAQQQQQPYQQQPYQQQPYQQQPYQQQPYQEQPYQQQPYQQQPYQPYQQYQAQYNGLSYSQGQEQEQFNQHNLQLQNQQPQSSFEIYQPDYLKYDLTQGTYASNLFPSTAAVAPQYPIQDSYQSAFAAKDISMNNIQPMVRSNSGLTAVDDGATYPYLINQQQRASTSSDATLAPLGFDTSSYFLGNEDLLDAFTEFGDEDPAPKALGHSDVSHQASGVAGSDIAKTAYPEPVKLQPVVTAEDVSKEANRAPAKSASPYYDSIIKDQPSDFDVGLFLTTIENVDAYEANELLADE